ncbi:hypothetical protein QUA87_21815 [Microcoleus sp. F6_C2]
MLLITRNLPLATEFLTTATAIESAIVRFGNIGERNECSINPRLSLHAHTIIDLSLKNSRIGKDLFCKGLEFAGCCILFLTGI